MNKRGILFSEVIFILLNIVFFALMFMFVVNSVFGANMKEKILAKEITLFINAARPETEIELDVSEYKKIADKHKIEDFVKIEDGKVSVTLSGESFVYSYYSDHRIESKLDGDFLLIKVKENTS